MRDDQVRLAITEINGNYFSSWLLCGPFPNPLYSGESVDYLASLGGELQAHPTVWSEVEWPAEKRIRWWKYTSPVPSVVDLAKIFDENTRVLAYAFCQIESSHEQMVKATFGSNDGIEIIFNGQRLFSYHAKRNLMPDEDQVMLPLKPGVNHLLLKMFQGKGDWGFSFRLPGLKIRNHEHKYRIEMDL